MMLTYVPGRPLSDFVDLFWLYEGGALPHAEERVLPSGTVELVINLGDGGGDRRNGCLREAVVAGPHSEPFVITTGQPRSILGVHFKPGGAFPFLNMPVGELHNLHVGLDALWGPKAGELRERLLEAPTALEKFRILERILRAQTFRPLRRHRAVAYALGEFQAGSHDRAVATVVDRTGLSHRRFVELFRAEVGLTPKQFCRVRRFQYALGLIDRRSAASWVDVALCSGYYDQAHFIHEFKSFCGLTPTAYLKCKGPYLNHIPLTE